jgi:hypothetical protein
LALDAFVAAPRDVTDFNGQFHDDIRNLHAVVFASESFTSAADMASVSRAYDLVLQALPKTILGIMRRFSVGQRILEGVQKALQSQRDEQATQAFLMKVNARLENTHVEPMTPKELQEHDAWFVGLAPRFHTMLSNSCSEEVTTFRDLVAVVFRDLVTELLSRWPDSFEFSGTAENEDHSHDKHEGKSKHAYNENGSRVSCQGMS